MKTPILLLILLTTLSCEKNYQNQYYTNSTKLNTQFTGIVSAFTDSEFKKMKMSAEVIALRKNWEKNQAEFRKLLFKDQKYHLNKEKIKNWNNKWKNGTCSKSDLQELNLYLTGNRQSHEVENRVDASNKLFLDVANKFDILKLPINDQFDFLVHILLEPLNELESRQFTALCAGNTLTTCNTTSGNCGSQFNLCTSLANSELKQANTSSFADAMGVGTVTGGLTAGAILFFSSGASLPATQAVGFYVGSIAAGLYYDHASSNNQNSADLKCQQCLNNYNQCAGCY